jgi:hypothetical protein
MFRGAGRRAAMDKFEEIGKRLEEELARLRKFVDEEVAPTAEKLSEAARKLEARVAARGSQASTDAKS